jgi:hypothetical protein
MTDKPMDVERTLRELGEKAAPRPWTLSDDKHGWPTVTDGEGKFLFKYEYAGERTRASMAFFVACVNFEALREPRALSAAKLRVVLDSVEKMHWSTKWLEKVAAALNATLSSKQEPPAQTNPNFCWECDDTQRCASAEICYAQNKGYPKLAAPPVEGKQEPGAEPQCEYCDAGLPFMSNLSNAHREKVGVHFAGWCKKKLSQEERERIYGKPGAEALTLAEKFLNDDARKQEVNFELQKRGIAGLIEQVRAGAAPPTDCDLRLGHIQCSAKYPHGDDGYLCCRYVTGHAGKHKTCYDNGEEWEENVGAAAGESTELRAAVDWVLNDAAYKAPELIGPVCARWIDRLQRAASQERSA